MVGRCPKNIKSLKGGVSCIDAAGHTCFCSPAGCQCGSYSTELAGQDAKNFDAHVEWCTRYDPSGKYNQFCKDHTQSLPGPPIVLGAQQAAGAIGLTTDNLTLLALGGLVLVALIVIVS